MNVNNIFDSRESEDSNLEIQLDWDAYWKRFQEAHGGDPVLFEGRMLFRDAWTYSATDPMGPEWMPPKQMDRTIYLMKCYWKIRKAFIENETRALKYQIDGLKALSRGRTIPLQQVVNVKNGEQATLKSIFTSIPTKDLDLLPLQSRLDFMKENLLECIDTLQSLDEEFPYITVTR